MPRTLPCLQSRGRIQWSRAADGQIIWSWCVMEEWVVVSNSGAVHIHWLWKGFWKAAGTSDTKNEKWDSLVPVTGTRYGFHKEPGARRQIQAEAVGGCYCMCLGLECLLLVCNKINLLASWQTDSAWMITCLALHYKHIFFFILVLVSCHFYCFSGTIFCFIRLLQSIDIPCF